MKMYIINSRLISSLKESINDMIREKIKWNHTKQKAGKSRKEKQVRSNGKLVDTIPAISILTLNMNGLNTLFNCQTALTKSNYMLSTRS